MNTTMKNTLSYEVSKTPFKDGYLVNNTAAVAELPGGELVTVHKLHIEKRFCFGESGYDAEEARNMAHIAQTSENYFIKENTKEYREMIKNLQGAMNHDNQYTVVIYNMFDDQDADCRLYSVDMSATWQILDLLGGSANLDTLPGTVVDTTYGGHPIRVATADEIQAVIDAYKEALAQHEKKLRAYLKRYGLSQVRAWTYWRDE